MQIIAEFKLERATPGTVRYKLASGDTGIETLYVRKDALNGEPAPERLRLMLTPINTEHET